MKKLILFFFLFLFACAKTEVENSFFMPDVDIYVVRGSNGFIYPSASATSASDYIIKVVRKGIEKDVNFYLAQSEISFLKSNIRIFYILSPNNSITYFQSQASFTLTDETGSQNKGTVNVDFNKMRIYFTKNDPNYPSAAGLSYLGSPSCFSNSYCRKNLVISILSGANGYSLEQTSKTLAHEIGHYFSLEHPFQDNSEPNPASCLPAKKGTTQRLMDYTSQPQYFAPCERILMAYNAQIWLSQRKSLDASSSLNTYKNTFPVSVFNGEWEESIIIGEKQEFIFFSSLRIIE